MLMNAEDINECLLRNGHGLCQDRCTNTFGSYSCSCDRLPGTRLSRDGHRCVDAGDCLQNNGGCAHRCVAGGHGRVFCQCDEGYAMGADLRSCKGSDECLCNSIVSSSPVRPYVVSSPDCVACSRRM